MISWWVLGGWSSRFPVEVMALIHSDAKRCRYQGVAGQETGWVLGWREDYWEIRDLVDEKKDRDLVDEAQYFIFGEIMDFIEFPVNPPLVKYCFPGNKAWTFSISKIGWAHSFTSWDGDIKMLRYPTPYRAVDFDSHKPARMFSFIRTIVVKYLPNPLVSKSRIANFTRTYV